MKIRDEKGNIIDGEHIEVAVKQSIVRRSKASKYFPLFMREVFIQKHPCIVRTFGGYWPDPEDLDEDEAIEPWIIMERMTHNLRHVLDEKMLTSLESKRRVLGDIVEGIAHLHSRGMHTRLDNMFPLELP